MAQLIGKDVTLGYEGNVVIEHLNFSVQTGDYLYIVGENGSGKSTLMKAILGLKSPMAGTITTGDGLQPDEIGYLPQQTAVQRDFPASVLEIVRSGCLNHSGFRPFYTKQEKQLALDNMERLGITHLAKRCYRELSGGQQQRVLLARALGATQKMLVLDEPVTGLDPKAQLELYELIAQLNRKDGITILMVSHDMEAAVKYASHVLHISKTPCFSAPKRTISAARSDRHTQEGQKHEYLGTADRVSVIFICPVRPDRRGTDRSVFLPAGSYAGAETVFRHRGRTFSRGIRGTCHCHGAAAQQQHAADNAGHSGLCSDLALCQPECQDQRRCCHCHAVCQCVAIGYLIQNLFSSSANISGDVCSTLFGSTLILTLSKSDVWLCVGMSVVVMAIFLLFYHKIFAVTFDETFAAATGIRAGMYNLLIAVVTAVIIVLAMNLVGSLLTSALIVFPALSAMRLFRSFRGVIFCAAVISVVCAVVGLLISILASTPVGATIVIADLVAFLGCCGTGAVLRRK